MKITKWLTYEKMDLNESESTGSSTDHHTPTVHQGHGIPLALYPVTVAISSGHLQLYETESCALYRRNIITDTKHTVVQLVYFGRFLRNSSAD